MWESMWFILDIVITVPWQLYDYESIYTSLRLFKCVHGSLDGIDTRTGLSS